MSAAEAAPRLTILALFLVVSGIFTLFQTTSSNPTSVVLASLMRPAGWMGVAAGLIVMAIATLAWKRAARTRMGYLRSGLTRRDLLLLSPSKFEEWSATRLREQGYSVTVVGGQSDHGIDLIAERDGERLVVQCKRWVGARMVGEPQVRDLFGAMHHERATGAMVITTGLFSEPALAWAKGKPIKLWDVERLIGSVPLQVVAPVALSKRAQSCPNCTRPLVQRTNRKNRQPFLGCTGFPACRYTQPI
jgi:restriction system protein